MVKLQDEKHDEQTWLFWIGTYNLCKLKTVVVEI